MSTFLFRDDDSAFEVADISQVNSEELTRGQNSHHAKKGGAANDTLSGTDANELFYGNAGDDWICAGKGNDLISGGTGKDTYVWHSQDLDGHSDHGLRAGLRQNTL